MSLATALCGPISGIMGRVEPESFFGRSEQAHTTQPESLFHLRKLRRGAHLGRLSQLLTTFAGAFAFFPPFRDG